MGFPVVRLFIVNVRRHAYAVTAQFGCSVRYFCRRDSCGTPAGSVLWAGLDGENGAGGVEQDPLGI